MTFKKLLIILFLGLLFSPASYAEVGIEEENLYANLELYEFSHVTTFLNVVFLDQNARAVKMGCTILPGGFLRISVVEGETVKIQEIRMSDCKSKLSRVSTSMVENPLERKLSIVFDYKDNKDDVEYFKFSLGESIGWLGKQRFVDKKVERLESLLGY